MRLRRRPFRGEWYWHVARDRHVVDFRVVSKQNGLIVATSGQQGYERPADAIDILVKLGVARSDIAKVDR